MRVRPAGVVLLMALVALVVAPVAGAHSGGKAEPRIAASVSGSGLERTVRVRLTDIDDGDPVEGASVTVAASMQRPHPMELAPVQLAESGGGRYAGDLTLVMPAVWALRIEVSGEHVETASATVRTRATLTGSVAPARETALPTTIVDTLTRSDYADMAVLWIHGLASMGWILGVLVMALALATDPGITDERLRARLSRWYRRVGAWLHWALVPVIVLTGIYNIRRVTPFALEWTPSGLRRLGDVPYGPLYEGILVVKLALFAVLLITATLLLLRVARPAPPRESPPEGAARILWSALGIEGAVYLVTVPLILAAAMALRYVHILNHVAVVLSRSR